MSTAVAEAPTVKRDIKPLPAPNSDFFELAETLSAEELAACHGHLTPRALLLFQTTPS